MTVDTPFTKTADDLKPPAHDPGLSWRRKKREQLNLLGGELDINASSFSAHWLDLAYHFAPYAERFLTTDVNQGRKKNFLINKGTGPRAVRTLRAGMMASVTSPQRPWFALKPVDPKLEDDSEVQQWCYENTQRMHTQFGKTNLYEVMPRHYGDGATFGSSLIWMEEDFEQCFRFYNCPIGSFKVSLNARGMCDTVMHETRMTVRQIVEKFGRVRGKAEIRWENISEAVKTMYTAGQMEEWVDVRHFAIPNDEFDPQAWGIKGMRYITFWMERGVLNTSGTPVAGGAGGSEDDKFLKVAGYQLFPGLYFTWEKTASDFYATTCPGMEALGDNRELQLLRRRMAQAVDKMLNPPLVASYDTKQQKSSQQPGDVTYVKDIGPNVGMKPVYQVTFDLVAGQTLSSEIEHDIEETFYVDLFRAVLDDERRMPATAEEIKTKKGEGLLLLGPTFQNLTQGTLEPLVANAYDMMMMQGKLLPPPKKLAGKNIKVEFTSIMAEAMKLMSATAMQTFAGFLTTTSGLSPESMDMVDMDQLVVQFAKTIGTPPLVVRASDKAAKIREQRAQAQQAQQQVAQAQQQAETAKTMAAAKTNDPSMLTQMLQRQGDPQQAIQS